MCYHGPNIIISTKVGGQTKYVFNAPIGVDKKRRPVLVDDHERAKRFWTRGEAHNYITFFAQKSETDNYEYETYRPTVHA